MGGRGKELMEQAEKRLKKWSLFGGGSKYEEAAELFDKAGNQFKLAQDYQSAGTAYRRSSDCLHHSKDPYGCATKLVDAAHCFKRVQPKPDAEQVVRCLETAADILTDEGKFSNAAKLMKELGEFHKETEAFDKAVAAYLKAADFFSGEEQHNSANGALLEVAKVYAEELRMNAEAVEVYERVAKSYVAHGSMKFQVKDLLMRAMLCRFAEIKASNVAEQASACRDALARYIDLDVHLQGTRECDLLEGVLSALESEEPEAVSKAASDYNGVKKLDDWQVGVLAGLKEVLTDDAGALC